MEFRVLDEVVEIEGKGVALLAATLDCESLYDGCKIRDSRSNVHIVNKINRDEPLTSLYISGGNAAYFHRLFRNILIDATLFVLCNPEDNC